MISIRRGFRSGLRRLIVNIEVKILKKLLVLANEFPYGTWEPYMETEERYYTCFDKVWIASLQLRKEHAKTKRQLTCGATVIPVPYMSRLFYLINTFSILLDGNLYRELLHLLRSGRLSLSRIIDLFVFLSRAHHEARVIDRFLKEEDKDGVLLYAYRSEYQPYVAMLLRKKWKKPLHIVSRAHGYDVYEERHHGNYIPLRETILSNIDSLFPCSLYGVEYIKEKYGDVKAAVQCEYLGTIDHGEHMIPSGVKPFKIVSCSNVVEVKRLDKIVHALAGIHDIEIEWTHYGDGPLLDEVKKLAQRDLPDNIAASFPGNVTNQQLMNEYVAKDYHVFLNVSSSEGLPVSIMEAMSFGIPCIATDVGGTKEEVNNENGRILDADVSADVIADAIRQFYEMDSSAYRKLRKNAREGWMKRFNCDMNYPLFVEKIKNIGAKGA